jgi:UDP-N-acetylglucosamine 2-epimerase
MPEEHNRIMTDQLADFLFTTGPEAGVQLTKEGVHEHRIVEVGDVMLDLALAVHPLLDGRSPAGWPSAGPVLTVTLHRPATVDRKEVLIAALEAMRIWMQETGGTVYFPVHPRTRKALDRFGLVLPSGAVDPGPLGYLDMQAALRRAVGVLTDSGGVQKEAWYQGTKAVILRDNTEWKELIHMGASTLFGPSALLGEGGAHGLAVALLGEAPVPPIAGTHWFGGGTASLRIAETLRDGLK